MRMCSYNISRREPEQLQKMWVYGFFPLSNAFWAFCIFVFGPATRTSFYLPLLLLLFLYVFFDVFAPCCGILVVIAGLNYCAI